VRLVLHVLFFLWPAPRGSREELSSVRGFFLLPLFLRRRLFFILVHQFGSIQFTFSFSVLEPLIKRDPLRVLDLPIPSPPPFSPLELQEFTPYFFLLRFSTGSSGFIFFGGHPLIFPLVLTFFQSRSSSSPMVFHPPSPP